MIASSLLAAALILSASATNLIWSQNFTSHGLSYVKGIDLGVAQLVPKTDMLLIKIPNATNSTSTSKTDIGHFTGVSMDTVVKSIKCSRPQAYITCQHDFQVAITSLDIHCFQPDTYGKSILDYVVESFLALSSIERRPVNGCKSDLYKHYMAIFNSLVQHRYNHALLNSAIFVWENGYTLVKRLMDIEEFEAAAYALNFHVVIPQASSLFVQLVESNVFFSSQNFKWFFKTLPTDELFKLASWPQITAKLDEIVIEINLRPLRLEAQRWSLRTNAQTMYCIGQYYAYLIKLKNCKSFYSFCKSYSSDEVKLAKIARDSNNLKQSNFELLHRYFGLCNSNFDDYSLQWNKIVTFQGFQYSQN